MSNLITSILDTVTQYQNAKIRSYQNILHVMLKESEMLVPNKTEEYVFHLNDGWKIINQDKECITIKKV